MRGVVTAGGVLALLVVVCGLSSSASAQVIPDFPKPGSPSGKIYEIPLDSARGDAAPQVGTGKRPGSAPATDVRSENGFGSSSRVPEGARRSSQHVRNGRGSETTGSARSSAEAKPGLPARLSSVNAGASSTAGPFLLLAGLVALGALAGILGWSRTRRRSA